MTSRTQEIEAARDRKTNELKPEEVSPLERRLLLIRDKKILERISAGIYGLRLKIGGMATGEGLALDPSTSGGIWRMAIYYCAAQLKCLLAARRSTTRS